MEKHLFFIDTISRRRYDLTELAKSTGKIYIGRIDNKNDIGLGRRNLPDLTYSVSRHHATITVLSNNLYLNDEDSFGGTFMNGKKVPEGGCFLKSGRLAFGFYGYYGEVRVKKMKVR